jgi:hypothetical protein
MRLITTRMECPPSLARYIDSFSSIKFKEARLLRLTSFLLFSIRFHLRHERASCSRFIMMRTMNIIENTMSTHR